MSNEVNNNFHEIIQTEYETKIKQCIIIKIVEYF
jgi:hypothetical protein